MSVFKSIKHLFPALLLFWSIFSQMPAESGIYDRIGIISEHGRHGAVPEENIDLFTGNLTLKNLDIHLPGPNGFDLDIWRVYNSKILKDRLLGSMGHPAGTLFLGRLRLVHAHGQAARHQHGNPGYRIP